MSGLKRRKSGKKSKKDKTTTEGGATTGDEKTDEEKETEEATADSADEVEKPAETPAEVPPTDSTEKTTSDGDAEKDETEGNLLVYFSYFVDFAIFDIKFRKRNKKAIGYLETSFWRHWRGTLW